MAAYRSPLPAMREAAIWFGGAMASMAAVVTGSVSYAQQSNGIQNGSVFEILMPMLFLGLPVAAGIVTGLRTRQRASMGVFLATGATAFAFGITAAAIDHVSLPSTEVSVHWQDTFQLIALMCCIWMPIGCVTAATAGLCRDRRRLSRAMRGG